MEIKTYLNEKKDVVEKALERLFPQPTSPFSDHIEAMRYSLFAGGKRIRPILCLAAAEAVGANNQLIDELLPAACALECIHTYSLVHDDLPAMDNDELRRGKPTNHVIFGEAGAILAGDGLLTIAFELISQSNSKFISAEQYLAMIHVLARSAGSFGMVGGQALDIANENQDYPFETLKTIHRSKTGALITGAVHMGAIGGGAGEEQTQALLCYGDKIGLAFQIVDDLLNATATTEQLGKKAGSDAALGKATYPGHFGIEETRKKAMEATEKAKEALAPFDDRAAPLRGLADYIRSRTH